MSGYEAPTQQWLEEFIAANGGVAGTVHRVSPQDPDTLQLRAAVNIPPKVVEVTSVIPRGKGMAGLALERNKPVMTCDLATDKTGDVRPGARAVEASGAVAVPVHDGEGNVRAVVGVAYAAERDFNEEELQAISKAACALP